MITPVEGYISPGMEVMCMEFNIELKLIMLNLLDSI